MEKSILSKMKDKNSKKKMTAEEKNIALKEEKRKLRRMKHKEEDLTRDKIFEVETSLRQYEDKFQQIYRIEIKKAGIDEKNGKKDPRKYARIGAAFYCSQIIREARKRIEEQKDDFEFKTTMDGMLEALTSIRELNGEIGTWNIKKIKKEAKNLSSSSSGAGKTLIRTMEMAKNLDFKNEDKTMIENLVDYGEIEKWIADPAYAEECWKTGEGTATSVEEVLDYAEEETKEEGFVSNTVSDLEMMLNSLS